MAVEIEIKARLDDFEALRGKLYEKGVFLREYDKYDTYWTVRDMAFRVRVRKDNDITYVTFKQKKILEKMEVNQEREFEVSDAGMFEELLSSLGLIREFKKEKRGWAWKICTGIEIPILAELSDVRGLGWFLELEILAPDDDHLTVEYCHKRLFALLNELGVSPDMVEPKPYMVLLKEAENGGEL